MTFPGQRVRELGRRGPRGGRTTGGRYFVTARITDRLGQVLEDTALVTVGEAGGPDGAAWSPRSCSSGCSRTSWRSRARPT